MINHKNRAFTLIELMVVVSIVAIMAVVAISSCVDVYNRNNVVSLLVIVKNAILKSRIRAVENTANVRFSVVDGRLLSLIDLDRNGGFGQDANGTDDFREVVVGESVSLGVNFRSKGAQLTAVTDPEIGGSILHPSGAYNITPSGTGFSTFTNDEFLIGPTGIVRDTTTNTPTHGTLFLKLDNGNMLALVHISALGEVVTALKEKGHSDWT